LEENVGLILDPPNLSAYLEKNEIFKDGDKTKSIEIGKNRPYISLTNSNVYIGGNFEKNPETDIQCVAICVKSKDLGRSVSIGYGSRSGSSGVQSMCPQRQH
jgi:hypothetical protein